MKGLDISDALVDGAIGAIFGAIKGIGAAYFGMTAVQGFAVGSLAVDFSAFVIMPIFAIEIPAIECEKTEN